MDNRTIISPSILAADFGHLADTIRTVESAGAQWIHIDVMDGHFVPNITMGPFIVKTVRSITQLPLDVHLMITNPERYLEDFAAAGA
ncbi:MAG: ribulose-phosphate 3-epimerase, partial [Anaerolineales bacterium]